MEEGRERAAGREPVRHVTDGPRLAALAAALPWELTDEQEAARDDILAALAAPATANHLLLGDVGTGKTVVAAHALAAAADTGGQALLMAPTEVLARQHGKSLGPLFGQAGISWGVLTGSTPPGRARGACSRAWRTGAVDVLVGTHALSGGRRAPQRDLHARGHRRAAALRRGPAGASCWRRAMRPTRCTSRPRPFRARWRWRCSATLPCPTSSTARTTRRARTTKVYPKQRARPCLRRRPRRARARRAGVRGVPARVGKDRRRARREGRQATRRGGATLTRTPHAAISIEDDADLDGRRRGGRRARGAYPAAEPTFVDYTGGASARAACPPPRSRHVMAALPRRARRRCSWPPRSSRWAWTCPTPRS